MTILDIYEGALYYFDKTVMHLQLKKYDKAMNSLTKGYKHIKDSHITSETKAKKYINMSVKNIQNENFERANNIISKLCNIIDSHIKNNIINTY